MQKISRLELAFLVVIYALKKPLYIQDEDLSRFSYSLSRCLAFIHFVFILFYQHFKPFTEYTWAIINEFYSTIFLKQPYWQSENVRLPMDAG